ncbi:tyrosine-type recombinase/integrase [Sphingomonas lenta]|uniref:Integrase n=1 Tax=Sphingomonas lenta TaxID=1141887 RepID=A0A2A2SI22_9SPHN|nr:site-specific integrase [Sphingomonas lenta]PAX08873.1 integrase [Sphingomonas lenta]
MTALALRQVVADALAEVGANVVYLRLPKGKPRTTTWIGVEHGFGIRHYATGRNVYIVQTRMAGRLRTVTIGPASVITRHQATMVARRVIAHAQVGLDPATDRKRIRSAPRFDDFLNEYWARWSPHWKASTYDTQCGYRALYLDGAFPGVFIDALNEADVTKWFADLNNRTGPGAANRVMSILNNMLNKAEAWGYRLENTNPCRAVRLNRRRQCERFLSTAEMRQLGRLLAEERAGEDRVRPIMATAITLLLLTGCRVSEILGLQWQDVRGNRLNLRDSKTGPRTVWLGDEARALIGTLPRLKNVPWLFWNARFRKPIRAVTHYWHDFRDRAGLPKVRLHDLRHTFASHAAMNKETLPMIGRLLGHRNHQSTARYAHLDDEHVLDAAEQIGAAIERMMT